MRRLIAALALAVAMLLPGAAAQAHDVIEASSPADGATVQAVPEAVTLTFDHTPIAVGTEVQVKDPTGANRADGAAKIVDNVVTQPVKPGGPAGVYTVVWRVVSSDSHPIEGTFTFTAKAGASTAVSAGVSAPAATTPSAAPASTAGASDGAWGLWVGIAAAVVVVIAALAFFVRRAVGRT